MYVMGLVVSGCVNTMPAATLEASAAYQGPVVDTVTGTQVESRGVWDELGALGISEPEVCQKLEDEGVEKFDASWAELLDTVSRSLDDARHP
jgi:transaldolase